MPFRLLLITSELKRKITSNGFCSAFFPYLAYLENSQNICIIYSLHVILMLSYIVVKFHYNWPTTVDCDCHIMNGITTRVWVYETHLLVSFITTSHAYKVCVRDPHPNNKLILCETCCRRYAHLLTDTRALAFVAARACPQSWSDPLIRYCAKSSPISLDSSFRCFRSNS